MRAHLQLVTSGFKPASGEDLRLDSVEATMEDLAGYYIAQGDMSAALALSAKYEEIKKIHATHEKGQQS